jgi:hypothetical protein
MNTLVMHVLPVGQSLLDNIGKSGDLAALSPVLSDPRYSVHDQLRQATDGTTHALDLGRVLTTEKAREAARTGDYRVSAEWTSVAVHRAGRRVDVTAEAFVLIASDTDEGLRAATLVAAQYADEHTLRYIAEPTAAGHLRIEPGEVRIVRIPDLDLGKKQPTDRTWFSLGTVGHVIQTTARMPPAGSRWEVVLHLTGGYKAMIPYLLVMAEGIKSVFHDPQRVTSAVPTISAVTVHEASVDRAAGAAVLVELPVRWLDVGPLGDVLGLKDRVGGGVTVDSDRWDDFTGQLIERDRTGQRQLTSAGKIMVRVV